MAAYKVQCQACKQIANVEYVVANVSAHELPHYCCYCGYDEVKSTMVDYYWQEMAEAFGYSKDAKGAELIHGLYLLWDRTEYQRFRDFVEHMQKEFAK